MKFAAVVLLACVAVSSAAFTANLVQQTQPAVDKAMFQLRLAAGNKAIQIPAVNQILEHIQATIQGVIAQAQQVIQQGQQLSAALQQQLLNAAQALQNIAGGAVPQVQAVIQQLVQSIQSLLGVNSKGLLDNFDISGLIEQAQAAIQQAVALAQSLVSQLDLHALAIQAVNQVLPQPVAQLVLSILNLNNRGVIGDLFGNLWSQITGAAGQIASQVAQIVQQITSVGQSAVADIQAQASHFLQQVSQGAATLSQQAAQELLLNIGQLQTALGHQYQAVVDALNGIVISGN